MLYLTLDDIEFSQDDYSDLNKVSFTIRQKTRKEAFEADTTSGGFGNRFATSFSSDITFYGKAYTYVFNKLVAPDNDADGDPDPGTGLKNRLRVKIYEDCCPDDVGNKPFLVFEGYIDVTTLKWCVNVCEITGSITADEIDRNERCLKNKRIYDYETPFYGHKFYEHKHPFIWYCQEVRPAFLLDALYALYILLLPLILFIFIVIRILTLVIALLALIVLAVNAIINLVTFGLVDLLPDLDFSDIEAIVEFPTSLIKDLGDFIHGCKKGHPAPYARDYLTHVCEACGLKFRSSILNDPNSPYYNTVYLYAPVSDGVETYVPWIDDNKPLLTGEALLEEISQIFDGDYAIVDNGSTLIFERWDFFTKTPPLQFLDARLGPQKYEPNNDIINVCFSFPSKPLPAFGNFKYTLDGVDWAGNEAKKEYSDIVDWNLPLEKYPQFKGEALYNIPYAPARFRFDGIKRDPHIFWQRYARLFLAPYWGLYPFMLLAFGGDPITLITPDSDKFDRALLLPLGVTTQPKLLILGDTTLENAKVVRINTNDSDVYRYNTPMWISAPLEESELRGINTVDKYVPQPNLYTEFFKTEDPRNNVMAGIEYEVELFRKCEYLNPILSKEIFSKFVLLRIAGQDVKGRIDEVVIASDKLTIKGII